MDRMNSRACRALLIIALQACLFRSKTPLTGQSAPHPRRIAVFGSTGAEHSSESVSGYATAEDRRSRSRSLTSASLYGRTRDRSRAISFREACS
jgi:hypothetical protein